MEIRYVSKKIKQVGQDGRGGRGVDSTREQRGVGEDILPLTHLMGNPLRGVSRTGRTLCKDNLPKTFSRVLPEY